MGSVENVFFNTVQFQEVYANMVGSERRPAGKNANFCSFKSGGVCSEFGRDVPVEIKQNNNMAELIKLVQCTGEFLKNFNTEITFDIPVLPERSSLTVWCMNHTNG